LQLRWVMDTLAHKAQVHAVASRAVDCLVCGTTNPACSTGSQNTLALCATTPVCPQAAVLMPVLL
jgi:hypothetical protein